MRETQQRKHVPQGLYNALMMEDDENYAAAAEDGEAPAKAKGRKKGEGAVAKPVPKRKPAQKRPAGRASKPAAKRAKKK